MSSINGAITFIERYLLAQDISEKCQNGECIKTFIEGEWVIGFIVLAVIISIFKLGKLMKLSGSGISWIIVLAIPGSYILGSIISATTMPHVVADLQTLPANTRLLFHWIIGFGSILFMLFYMGAGLFQLALPFLIMWGIGAFLWSSVKLLLAKEKTSIEQVEQEQKTLSSKEKTENTKMDPESEHT